MVLLDPPKFLNAASRGAGSSADRTVGTIRPGVCYGDAAYAAMTLTDFLEYPLIVRAG